MNELRNKALSAIDELKAAGADKSQVQFQEGETREMTFENTDFTLYRTLFDENVSITVYKDNKKGSYATNKTDAASVTTAIKAAMDSAMAGSADEAYDIAENQGEISKTEGPLEPDEDLLFSRIKELKAAVEKEYKKVNLFQIIGKYIRHKSVIANSNGTIAKKQLGCYQFMLEFNGKDGERVGSIDSVFFMTKDLNSPLIDADGVRTHLSNAEKQLEAKPYEGKFTGTIVFDPGMASTVFGHICNMAGGSAILEKTSVYIDKLDKKIADDRITLSFIPDDDRIIGSGLLASGDFKAEAYNFIENGVLKNYDIDYYIEKKTGFKHAPNSGDGMILAPGTKSLAEIIKGIKKGILCYGFSGGAPGINGEFSGVAKNSFLIENGESTCALAETMISGNFADMLNNLVDISKETECGGMSVMPYIAFNGVTISGK